MRTWKLKDLVKDQNISLEKALNQAQKEFSAMLPEEINLYTKCGYGTFRELEDEMYMKKDVETACRTAP